MIKIAILTATRAEYGLMRQLIFNMSKDPDIDLEVLVTGTHLSNTFGYTINEIINDGVKIAKKIEIIEEKDGKVDVGQTFSNAVSSFSHYFATHQYNFLLVDGDRYEALAVCIAAAINQIPIIHCSGGATTEGANDEYWRHAMTKMSSLHFPTMDIYRERLLRMGENPNMVFTVGSMGLENIRCMKFMTLDEVQEKVGIDIHRPFALVTFHPVTLENDTASSQIDELLDACDRESDMSFIFTKANADHDGAIINKKLEEYVKQHSKTSVCVASLGAKCYLSAMNYCSFVMGNSSSGLIETPSFHIPTINIGDRQKGREQAKSIINCSPVSFEISQAIKKALDPEFRKFCQTVSNPNGDGYVSEKIISHIKEVFASGANLNMKKFYDYDG